MLGIHRDPNDVKTGKVESWMIEGGSPNTLFGRGVRKESLKAWCRNHNGPNRGNGRDVAFAIDGRSSWVRPALALAVMVGIRLSQDPDLTERGSSPK
jgi:hypothetical protein